MTGLAWKPPIIRGTEVWATNPPRPDVTLPLMVQLTMRSYEQPELVQVAASIAATAEEKNPRAIIGALLAWLRAHTRFVDDPVGEQVLKSPLVMLATIAENGVAGGDCVDLAMLGASLAMAVGLTANFISEGYDGSRSKLHADLTHVYAVVQAQDDQWYALDTQRPIGATPITPTDRVRLTIP